MHATCVLLSILLLVLCVPGAARSLAAGDVTELSGPGAFTGPTTVIDFDAAPDGAAANTLYAPQGVAFSNCTPLPCTSAPVPIENWTDPPLSRVTTSPTNVIATTDDYQGSGSELSDFLDLFFAAGTLEVGAWFGNDQGIQPTMQMQLSVYDASDALIGLVLVDENANTSVDQFAGLRSNSTPFYRARFEHVLEQGSLSVVLDDVRFSTPVPEPGSAALLGFGVAAIALRRRRRARV